MTIEPEYVGVTYRQIAPLLRVPRGAGRAKLLSERPVQTDAKGNVSYVDSEAVPTLITFDADCIVDVALLLQTGSVVPYEAPKVPRAPKGVG